MPILPIISAERTLNKVLCLALDIKHSAFDNGEYNICNDTIEHTRTDENGKSLTYLPCPFTFNIPSQSETDDTNISITNVGLLSSQILSKADNSLEDIIVHGWLIVADYNGNSAWISLGEYYLSTQQNETVDAVSATLTMKTCYGINAGKYRGDNPNIFINLNYR